MKREPRNKVEIEIGDRMVGTTEIANRLQISPGLVRMWRTRDWLEFPEPVFHGYGADFFDWHEIQKWCQVHRPELLLPKDERDRRAAEAKRQKKLLEKINRVNKMHTPLGQVTKKDIAEMAKGWREQDKPMTDYLSLELMRRGYRWEQDRTDWDDESFQQVMTKVIAATREYQEYHPDDSTS